MYVCIQRHPADTIPCKYKQNDAGLMVGAKGLLPQCWTLTGITTHFVELLPLWFLALSK